MSEWVDLDPEVDKKTGYQTGGEGEEEGGGVPKKKGLPIFLVKPFSSNSTSNFSII